MNDIVINWRLVTRGMPRGNHAANDRFPTIEEIIQILKYPDVRIKAIVLTMASWVFGWVHGITLGGNTLFH